MLGRRHGRIWTATVIRAELGGGVLTGQTRVFRWWCRTCAGINPPTVMVRSLVQVLIGSSRRRCGKFHENSVQAELPEQREGARGGVVAFGACPVGYLTLGRGVSVSGLQVGNATTVPDERCTRNLPAASHQLQGGAQDATTPFLSPVGSAHPPGTESF